jgi:hypothetical protein
VLFAGNLRIHRDDKILRNDTTGILTIKNFQLENAGEYRSLFNHTLILININYILFIELYFVN